MAYWEVKQVFAETTKKDLFNSVCDGYYEIGMIGLIPRKAKRTLQTESEQQERRTQGEEASD